MIIYYVARLGGLGRPARVARWRRNAGGCGAELASPIGATRVRPSRSVPLISRRIVAAVHIIETSTSAHRERTDIRGHGSARAQARGRRGLGTHASRGSCAWSPARFSSSRRACLARGLQNVSSRFIRRSMVDRFVVPLRASARSLVVDMSASARGATVARIKFVFNAFANGKVGARLTSGVRRACVRVLGAGVCVPRAGSTVDLGRRGPGAAARDLWGSGDGRRQVAARERKSAWRTIIWYPERVFSAPKSNITAKA